jgi:hypothetical protein
MNVVLTNLLTKVKDPARRKFMRAHPDMFAALRESVHAHGHHLIVFHDCLHAPNDEQTSFVRVVKGGNPYFARWRHIAHWLGQVDHIDKVWCVDATDVVMLRDPFPHMRPGVLYSGADRQPTLGGDSPDHRWLYDNHPSHREWCIAHPDRPFLNPGILGGDHADVLAATTALGVGPDQEMTDMGAWQQIAHERFNGRLVTGHPVHTEYRALDHANPDAWWAHK